MRPRHNSKEQNGLEGLKPASRDPSASVMGKHEVSGGDATGTTDGLEALEPANRDPSASVMGKHEVSGGDATGTTDGLEALEPANRDPSASVMGKHEVSGGDATGTTDDSDDALDVLDGLQEAHRNHAASVLIKQGEGASKLTVERVEATFPGAVAPRPSDASESSQDVNFDGLPPAVNGDNTTTEAPAPKTPSVTHPVVKWGMFGVVLAGGFCANANNKPSFYLANQVAQNASGVTFYGMTNQSSFGFASDYQDPATKLTHGSLRGAADESDSVVLVDTVSSRYLRGATTAKAEPTVATVMGYVKDDTQTADTVTFGGPSSKPGDGTNLVMASTWSTTQQTAFVHAYAPKGVNVTTQQVLPTLFGQGADGQWLLIGSYPIANASMTFNIGDTCERLLNVTSDNYMLGQFVATATDGSYSNAGAFTCVADWQDPYFADGAVTGTFDLTGANITMDPALLTEAYKDTSFSGPVYAKANDELVPLTVRDDGMVQWSESFDDGVFVDPSAWSLWVNDTAGVPRQLPSPAWESTNPFAIVSDALRSAYMNNKVAGAFTLGGITLGFYAVLVLVRAGIAFGMNRWMKNKDFLQKSSSDWNLLGASFVADVAAFGTGYGLVSSLQAIIEQSSKIVMALSGTSFTVSAEAYRAARQNYAATTGGALYIAGGVFAFAAMITHFAKTKMITADFGCKLVIQVLIDAIIEVPMALYTMGAVVIAFEQGLGAAAWSSSVLLLSLLIIQALRDKQIQVAYEQRYNTAKGATDEAVGVLNGKNNYMAQPLLDFVSLEAQHGAEDNRGVDDADSHGSGSGETGGSTANATARIGAALRADGEHKNDGAPLPPPPPPPPPLTL